LKSEAPLGVALQKWNVRKTKRCPEAAPEYRSALGLEAVKFCCQRAGISVTWQQNLYA
jgi:hypothetical protein